MSHEIHLSVLADGHFRRTTAGHLELDCPLEIEAVQPNYVVTWQGTMTHPLTSLTFPSSPQTITFVPSDSWRRWTAPYYVDIFWAGNSVWPIPPIVRGYWDLTMQIYSGVQLCHVRCLRTYGGTPLGAYEVRERSDSGGINTVDAIVVSAV